MKYLVLFLPILFTSSCAFNYEYRVTSMDEKDLCESLAETWVYNKAKAHQITLNEVQKRNINEAKCTEYGDARRLEIEPKWKINVCQQVTKMYYLGNYPKYKHYMETIKRLGYADEECKTIGEFYVRKVKYKERKSARFAADFSAAMSAINRPGSYFNPIHVRVYSY